MRRTLIGVLVLGAVALSAPAASAQQPICPPGTGTLSVHLQAGKRWVQATDGKAARLVLEARRTKVRVNVAVAEGVAETTLIYRRCGARPRR